WDETGPFRGSEAGRRPSVCAGGRARSSRPHRCMEEVTMRKKSWLSSVLFTGLLLAPCALHAQQDTATLTGDVRDETGAGVPQASVVVTSVATNIPLRTETRARGSYTLPGLNPVP